MKKNIIISTLILVIASLAAIILTANNVRADYFDSALVNVWNNRKDLQKAFPGDPYNNPKLDAWCKKYGWKEDVSLSNCSPNAVSTNITIDPKYEERIAALEVKINELNNRINQMSLVSSNPVVNTVIQNPEGHWRNCRMMDSGAETFDFIYCDRDYSDSTIYVEDEGVNINTNWSSMSIWVR